MNIRSKFFTKHLFKLVTPIVSTVKPGFRVTMTQAAQWRCESDVDSENSEDLFEYIQSRSLSLCYSIKTLDFSTQLFSKLKELVKLCFIKNNGQHR